MTESRIVRSKPRRLALAGAPVEAGANVAGSRLGPSALRTIGLPGMLRKLGCDVADHGDLAPVARDATDPAGSDERATKASEVARWIPCLSDAAYRFACDGMTPVFLGGDHSLSMGTVDGMARYCADRGRELFVLWLDAHGDFNTPATSPSGNLHGMSVAYLCGEPEFGTALGSDAPSTVAPSNVFLFGTRSLDAGEGELLSRRGVGMIDMCAIRQQGIRAPLRRILEVVARREGVLHLGLDADLVDPSLAPGVNVPVSGGLTHPEAHLLMQMLNESGLVASLDIAELNPLLDVDGRTARVIAELVACLFDQKASDDHSRSEIRYGYGAARVS